MKAARSLLGILCAALGALTAAPLAWLLLRGGLFTGIAGLTGFCLSALGWRLGSGRSGGFGLGLAALLTPPAALPGLWYGCAELILRDNAQYGCTLQEALELVPMVALDPGNRAELLWALGGLIFMDLLCALLAARYLRLRRAEQINKR